MKRSVISTYRLQFNSSFPLSEVRALIEYLKRLGVSHIYSSPILQSSSGSNHGYDTVNLEMINPEIGGEEQFREMSTLVHNEGIGWIQDVVPNHMAINSQNVYLQDIFENGTLSKYHGLFDVFHSRNFGDSRIVLPILTTNYERAVTEGKIKVTGNTIDIEGSPFRVSRKTYNQDISTSDFSRFMIRQYFRPVYFRSAISGTNYRRFFSVNSLIAVRPERYFQLIMGKILELQRAGLIDGFRIDHIDGLYNPKGFISKLWRLTASPIYVEKILTEDEELEPSWPCTGTTGYDFLFHCNFLYVAGKNKEIIMDTYKEFTGDKEFLIDMVKKRKYEYMDNYFVSELDYLTDIFFDYLRKKPYGQEVNMHSVRNALKELLAHLPVYRTYVPEENSFAILKKALADARDHSYEDIGLDAVERMVDDQDSLHLFRRLQQFMPAIIAKSLEDAMFFRYVPLISLNEIGCDPGRFSITIQEFHEFNFRRSKSRPDSMNTLSTHDTKLGEDLRAKIGVISELPDEWRSSIATWNHINRDGWNSKYPSSKDEYYLYQILLAKSPDQWDEQFELRVRRQMLKAARESEEYTEWNSINSDYESAMIDFLSRAMKNEAFRVSYQRFYNRISLYGSLYAVCQNILKMTSPGIPDTYQGSELENNYFTDPDNRSVVDFKRLSKELDEIVRRFDSGKLGNLDDDLRSGRIKLLVTHILLNMRKSSKVFSGDYIPLETSGRYRDEILAFSRRTKNEVLVVAVPLNIASSGNSLPMGPFWEDTGIVMDRLDGYKFTDVFTEEARKLNGTLLVRDMFDRFPFSVIVGDAR